jgi:ComF family protein
MRLSVPKLTRSARVALRHVVDFCYPGKCSFCEAPCEGDVPLCEPCRIDLHALEVAPACARCAKPLAEHDAPCPYCKGKGVRPFETILRLAVFDDPVKHLIHLIKYHRGWPLAEFLADRLLDQERVARLLAQTDVLVPVPLYPLRQILRGYNQAEVIARRLVKKSRSRLKLAQPAVRLKNTESQTHLSPTKREENLRDAFGVSNPRSIRGRRVVLIDDVTTTGATLVSMARELSKAGPLSLSAMTIAIADPKGRGFEQV